MTLYSSINNTEISPFEKQHGSLKDPSIKKSSPIQKVVSPIFETKNPSFPSGASSFNPGIYSEELWHNLPIKHWESENKADKALKLEERVRILRNLEIPLSEESLRNLLKKIQTLKNRDFLNDPSIPLEATQKTYPVIIPERIDDVSYQLYVYPKKSKSDKRNSHEIFLSSMQSIGNGTYKTIHPVWSLTGKPGRFALCDSNFRSEKATPGVSEEVLYLKEFNGAFFAPKFYKSSINQNLNFTLMKYYPQDFFNYLEESFKSLNSDSGQSLDRSIENSEGDTLEKKINIALKLLKALRVIHFKGYVHRDIKPENILIKKNGNPIFCDFASTCEALSEKMKLTVGTLNYIPPEYLKTLNHIEERKLDEDKEKRIQAAQSTDIWSMGCVLWELFNDRQLPWSHLPKREKIKVVEELNSVEPNGEDKIRHLIWEMLHTNPFKRPSAEEAIRKLKDILKDFS